MRLENPLPLTALPLVRFHHLSGDPGQGAGVSVAHLWRERFEEAFLLLLGRVGELVEPLVQVRQSGGGRVTDVVADLGELSFELGHGCG